MMRASRGEIKIEEILQAAELPFKEEYIFPDLRSENGKPLRFDFAVFDDDGNIDFLEHCLFSFFYFMVGLAVLMDFKEHRLIILNT